MRKVFLGVALLGVSLEFATSAKEVLLQAKKAGSQAMPTDKTPKQVQQQKVQIQNSAEMSAPPKLIVEKNTSIPEYVKEFQKAYDKDTKIDFELIANSITMFEETLVTSSRYDEFMSGNLEVLSEEEAEGLSVFVEKGCASCHSGINLGETMQPFEVVKEYQFTSICGFKGDKDEMLKVPTLKNVIKTMPYFRNGQF